MPGPQHTGELTAALPRKLAEAGLMITVVEVSRLVQAPGGAANTARNLAALGARVRLVSAVGADTAGAVAVGLLDESGVDTSGVLCVPGRTTATKQRVVAGEQIIVRIDEPPAHVMDESAQRQMSGRLRAAARVCAALLVCDYDAGLFGPQVRRALHELRDEIPVVVVDAHDVQRWTELRPDVVTPNASEAETLLGTRFGEERISAVEAARKELVDAIGARHVVVTLDRDGAVVLPDGEPAHHTHADAVAEQHTTGAGDTFVAALTLLSQQEHRCPRPQTSLRLRQTSWSTARTPRCAAARNSRIVRQTTGVPRWTSRRWCA